MKISYITTKNHNGTLSPISGKEKLLFESQLRFVPTGQLLKVEISEYNEKKEAEELRTLRQNSYYHKLLDIICDYTGDEHMGMHEQLKIRFLSRPYIMEEKEYTIVKSTRGLKPKEFGDYLEKIFSWASEELELRLPDASEYY